jgi:hypothetical protein
LLVSVERTAVTPYKKARRHTALPPSEKFSVAVPRERLTCSIFSRHLCDCFSYVFRRNAPSAAFAFALDENQLSEDCGPEARRQADCGARFRWNVPSNGDLYQSVTGRRDRNNCLLARG